jgi:hypothetical protein
MIHRIRLKRWLAGCYYLGCFAPLAFAGLILYILADGLSRPIRALLKGHLESPA